MHDFLQPLTLEQVFSLGYMIWQLLGTTKMCVIAIGTITESGLTN